MTARRCDPDALEDMARRIEWISGELLIVGANLGNMVEGLRAEGAWDDEVQRRVREDAVQAQNLLLRALDGYIDEASRLNRVAAKYRSLHD